MIQLSFHILDLLMMCNFQNLNIFEIVLSLPFHVLDVVKSELIQLFCQSFYICLVMLGKFVNTTFILTQVISQLFL